MKHFIDGDVIAFDTETTGLRPWHGDMPFAFAFFNTQGESAYFEFEVDPYNRRVDTSTRESRLALNQVRLLLEDQNVTKVMHNAKFDIRICELAFGIRVAGPGGYIRDGGQFHETMFMSHVCNSDEINYKLKDLANRYVGIDRSDQNQLKKCVQRLRRSAKKLGWNIHYEVDHTPEGEKIKPVCEADYWLPNTLRHYRPDLVTEEESRLCRTYALRDVERTMLLYLFYSELMEELAVQHTYEKELALWPTVYKMEERGVRLDPKINQRELENCAEKWKHHYEEIKAVAGEDVNPDSPIQLRKLLYEDLQLPVNVEFLTDGGQSGNRLPGTSIAALKEMTHVPTVMSIVRYRSAAKAYSYFAKYRKFALPDPAYPGYVFIHADFRQLGPSTARFSCADPNLQQVTSLEGARGLDPIDCRGPFGPRPGYVWLSIDYKGMEVRIYADVAQDQKMLDRIANGLEVHDEVTNKGWGGYMNESGIRECIHCLGLDGCEHQYSGPVKEYWKQIGLTSSECLSPEEQRAIAIEFFQLHDWDIVRAQASLSNKVTKNKAKMVFFNKLFGGGPNGIKRLLRTSYQEARDFLHALDVSYPRIQEYTDEMIWLAKDQGYIRNAWDRRLSVPRDRAYKAVNYMIQGTAADLLKSAMIKCDAFFKEAGLDCHLIMTIHDELVFEVRREELTKRLVRKIQDMMEDTEGCLRIPMPTEASIVTRSWNGKDKLKLELAA